MSEQELEKVKKRLTGWAHWKMVSVKKGDYDKVPVIKEDEALFAHDIGFLIGTVERLQNELKALK